MNTTETNEDKILRSPAIQSLSGLSRATIWRLEQQNQFPSRIKLSERASGWRKSEVLKWIESR